MPQVQPQIPGFLVCSEREGITLLSGSYSQNGGCTIGLILQFVQQGGLCTGVVLVMFARDTINEENFCLLKRCGINFIHAVNLETSI